MQTQSPQHILVSGHSGAGKSTVSSALAKKLNMPLLAVDDSPEFKAFLRPDLSKDHLDPKHPEGLAFHELVKRLSRETISNAKEPSVIEGTQLSHLDPAELESFGKRVYVQGNARQILKQRLQRAKANWAEKKKDWTKEVIERKKKLGKSVYQFHDSHVKNYRNMPGTLKYNWRNPDAIDTLVEKLKSPDVYIIKGNPDVDKEHSEQYAKFYDAIKNHVELLGMSAAFDEGLSNTLPPGGKYWIGHSRGGDRLRFAPKGVQTLRLDDYEPAEALARQKAEYAKLFKELGVTNIADVPIDRRPKPGPEHYTFNPDQQAAVAKLLTKQAATLNTSLRQLLAKAELMGSRGRAKMYGRPEPEGRDYDYVVFTDDPQEQARLNTALSSLEPKGFSLKPRPGGFLTAHSPTLDLSYYPTSKRQDIHKAWSLMESGMSKDDAWDQVEREKQADIKPDVKLQEHQERVKRRMQEGENRLLLYHGLGSGKSLSSLAAAESASGPYTAVVPAALRPNYEKEIEKFTENSDPEVLSYTGIAMGKQPKQSPETLIFDEAHRLRNPETASAQAAQRLAKQTKNLLLLTGTPITNTPKDLAGLLSLLHNKTITPEQFEKDFMGYQKVYPSLFSRLTGKNVGEEPVIKNEAQLRELLRGKIDYQPSKTPEGVNVNEQVVRIPLSESQQRIQQAIRSKIPPSWLWKLDQEFPLTRQELASLNSFLTGLRQSSLSTMPFRADKDPLKAFQDSSKLQRALADLKEELGADARRKGIIYSNYIDAGLNPYAAALAKEKIPYGMYHGGVPIAKRKQVLDDYNAGNIRALLLGPAAAEGISTKGTNLIQLLDPHWHESRSSQAQGRGLRFDSHTDLPEDLRNVAVKRYISESQEPSTVSKLFGSQRQRTGDEILEALAARKEKLNESFRQLLREEGSQLDIKNQDETDDTRKKQANQPLSRRQVLNLLLKAKQHSDRKQYDQKNQIVRDLMQQSPQDWMIDDQKGRYKGVTHRPTNFRLHIDPAVIDSRVNSIEQFAKQAATIVMRKITMRVVLSTPKPQEPEKMSCTETLQDLLYNCIDASLMFKKCHWNAQGTMFKPLHDFLGEGYDLLDDLTDELAERLATLDSPADGSSAEVAARSALTALPTKFMQADSIIDELDTRLKTLVDKFEKGISETDDDPVTSNMLQDMTHKLEKYHWMLRRQKEKRQESAKEAAARVLMSFIRV